MYFHLESSPRTALLVLLAVAIPVSGCHGRHVVMKDEVVKLDGFDGEQEIALVDYGGEEVEFDGSCKLAFVADGEESEARGYVEIRFDDGWFVGTTRDGEAVRARLDDLDHFVVYVPDVLQAIGYTLAVVVSVAVTALIVIGILVVILVLWMAWYFLSGEYYEDQGYD